MTNAKATKRALLSSALALFLCFAMLIGTTFAWFTDKVESKNNIIKAGNLDVELYWSTDASTWEKVDENTNIFTNAYWEPGHTEVVYLKVVNEGSLALKYQLGVNVASEIGSVNVDNKAFKLSDFIKYGIVDGAQDYTRDQAIAAVEANATSLAHLYSSDMITLASGAEKIVTMVVYMPTTVGNEANHKKGAAVPTINLGINIMATQVAAESDSFDNTYDENAPFSMWDGIVPTEMPASLVVDGATQTIHVKDAAAFVYLSTLSAKWVEFYTDGNGRDFLNYANGAGADYYYSDRWTVSLEADIDLGNYPISPINIKIGESTGASAFNGNYHTIRNINTTTGLFADKARTTFTNLTLENVKATNGALIGSSDHGITNVTVKNAIISGADYVGGLVGYVYSSVNGCKVLDSSVVATGKEAGGLIGYVATSNAEATVASNTVNNVSVYAGNRAAGLAAQVNEKVKVYNNIIDTVTVGAADTSKYQPGAVVSNAIVPENVYDNTVKNAEVATKAATAADNAALKDALQNDTTVFLSEGEFSLPTMSGKEGITIIGAADGSTVVGGASTSTGFGGNFGKDTTIKNVTFSGSTNGARMTYANGGTSTFENCTFAGDSTYGFHIDESNSATFIFNNCTFSGFNAFAGDLEKVVFNNCTFLHNGNYGHTNIWSVAEFNNCAFGDKVSVGQGKDSGAKLYFNGVEESYHHEYIGSAESLFAFAKSVNEGNDTWSGQKVSLVADIDLENAAWTPIGQTGATEFKGTFDGQGYTIKNLNIDSSAQTGKHYSSGLFGWAETNVTIKNVKVDGAIVKGNHNVAVIVGYTYGGKVENCQVTNAEIICTHANDDACGDKCGLIVGYAGPSAKITNCTASDSTVTAGRDAGQLVGAGYTAGLTGCSATNVTVTAGGDCTGANINEAVIGRVLG